MLLVTDKILRSLGITKDLEDGLKQANISVAVFDETKANPSTQDVENALKVYKENDCDSTIAFGGGSAIDLAKAVGARIVRPKKPLMKMVGTLKVRRKIPLLIAIPTTAGTGSEATPAMVITDRETGRKGTINDFCLSPQYAVLDPKVTFSLPPHLTATTGIDALTHALESYVGRSTSKKTRAQSLEAVKLVIDNVETAYADGTNYQARANMLRASYLGGLCIAMAYVGYVHAVAHSLGGAYNIPHGLANSVLLPIVLEAYGKSAHKKLYKMAVHCGVANKEDGYATGAKKFITHLRELNKRLNIPQTLKGIKKEDIPRMAKYADKEGNPLYPVPKLFNAKELEQFYIKVADWREE